MQGRLVFRFVIFDIIPLFAAVLIASSYERFAPIAFVLVAALASFNGVLSIRDGATLARGGDVIERQKEPFLFWFGMSVHVVLVMFCLFLAVYTTFKT